MNTEIITIGDELIIGQVVDTNSAWIAAKLNESGIRVQQFTSIQDNDEQIIETLHGAAKRADLIIITGGLGPTNDDITKKALCHFFNTRLHFNSEVYKDVETFFSTHGKAVTAINMKQAEIPENSTPLKNKNGTAPGLWIEDKGKIYIAMPGVPHEMEAIMQEEVIPRLKATLRLPYIIHKTILTQGIAESDLAQKISGWEDALAKESIKLAYLPSVGMVRLRLSATDSDKAALTLKIEKKINELQTILGSHIFGFDEDTLEGVVGNMLRERKQTLSTAESCTGGYIAHLITSVPGSSDYYLGSVISYSNEIKIKELGVSVEILNSKGAVSQEVVEQMATGVKKRFGSDYSISVSGVAGPGGGTFEKPVGLVWIGIATPAGITSRKFRFGNHRLRNIKIAALTALNMLRKDIRVSP